MNGQDRFKEVLRLAFTLPTSTDERIAALLRRLEGVFPDKPAQRPPQDGETP